MQTKFKKMVRCAMFNYKYSINEYENLRWCYAPLYNESKPTPLNCFIETYNYQIKRRKDIVYNRVNSYFIKNTNFNTLPF